MADENENENVNESASASADAEAVENPGADEQAPAATSDDAVDETPTAGTEAAVSAEVEEPPAAEEAPEADAVEASEDEETTEPAAEPGVSSASPKAKRKRLPRALRPKKTRPKRVRSTERKPIVRLEKPEHERGRRQERQGTVVSDAMEKTIVVKVDVVKAHPKYKKVVRRSVKFHAHDEQSAAKVGDVVRIVETRPLSKTKRWRLAEVVEAAK